LALPPTDPEESSGANANTASSASGPGAIPSLSLAS
jgi:hypothetical protein